MKALPSKHENKNSPKNAFNMQDGLNKAWETYWQYESAKVLMEMIQATEPPQETIDIDFKIVS